MARKSLKGEKRKRKRTESPKKEGFRLEKLFDIGTYTSLVEKFTSPDDAFKKRRNEFFSRKEPALLVEKNAREVIKEIKSKELGKKELYELLELEEEGKNRKTVIKAIKDKLHELESVKDFFGKKAKSIVDAAKSGKFSKEELEELLQFEEKNKKRKTVKKALKKEIRKLKSVEDFFGERVTKLLPEIKRGRFSDEELKKLLKNELEGKSRKTVIRAIRKKIGPLKKIESSFQVEIEKPEEERKVKLERIEIEEREEWIAGIGTHKAEIEKEGEERFVAHILEEDEKEGLLSGVVKRLKKILGFSKKKEEEIKEIEGGLIREGADKTARVLEVDLEGKEREPDKMKEPTKEEPAKKEKEEPAKKDEDELSKIDFSEAEGELVTGIDKLLFIIKKMEKVRLDAAATKLNVTKKKSRRVGQNSRRSEADRDALSCSW